MKLKSYLSLLISILLSVVAAKQAIAQKNYGFVQQENIKVAGITQDSMIYNLPVTQKQTSRAYIDGMGRTVQSIGVQASPGQNDLVQPIAYDNLGRQTTSYLPYAGKATDTMGRYRPDAISTDQPNFYNQTSQYLIAKDADPFAQQVIESSPLQRPLQAGSIGNGFQPVSGQHYKTVSYRYNTSGDGNILIWNPDGTFTSGKYYAVSTLSVMDGKDEDNVEVLVFTDRAGRTVLKRQILSTGNLDTYYIYNLAGMISYVVPPKATALMIASGNYSLATAGVNKLIFHYVYDTMGRLVERTVPAKGVEYIVYDPVNRPVLAQDSILRVINVWRYFKYDVKGRVINTGDIVDATHTTRTSMQAYVNGMAASYNTTWFESRTTSATFIYYTENVFPTAAASPSPLTFNYYDDYDVDNNGTANFTYSTQSLSGELGATTAAVKGLPTVALARNIGSGISGGQWLTKVMFYDKRGNPIQVKSANHVYFQGTLTTTDISTTVPDFVGVPQITKVSKQTAAATTVTVQTNLTYDHMYRVKAVDQYYNGSATAIHVAAYTYNELGQVVKKGLGYVNATTWLQNVDMRYSIRGQLLSINNSKLSNDSGVTNGDTNDQFGMAVLYDQVDANLGNTASYSGRISGVKWMSSNGAGGTSYERAFKYYYDQLGRDTAAIYAERTAAGTGAFTLTHSWDENHITYDQNGNILTLNRNDAIQGSGGHTQIDNLVYSYDSSNPNQLHSVTDGTDANHTGAGFRNLTGTSVYTYTYDGNGNQTIDPYKGHVITYNALNKTDKIVFSLGTNRWIDYTYDASGNLLRKRQYDNNTLQHTTDYIDGFVYLDGTLQYCPMPEGRLVNNAGTLVPTYTISDMQGNVRAEFDNSGTGGALHLRQENSYYAFGLIMPGSAVSTPTNDNKNLYNGGSEWQKDFSNLPDYYQTFYRNYDAALGRFIAVDPKAESAASMTTYQYAGNNPIMYNDPLGDLLSAPGSHTPPPYVNISGANVPTGPLDANWQDQGAFAGGDGSPIGGFQSWGDVGAAMYALENSAYGGRAIGPSAGEITYFGSDKTAIDEGASYMAGFDPTLNLANVIASAYDNYNLDPNRIGNKLYINDKLDPTYNRLMAATPIGGGGHSFAYNNPDANGNAITDLNGNEGNGSLAGVVIGGNWKEGKDESLFEKGLSLLDRAGTYTETLGFSAKNAGLLNVTGEAALGFVGDVVGATVVGKNYYDAYKAYKQHNYLKMSVEALKGTGTGLFLIFGGVETRATVKGAELLWNLGGLLIEDAH